jgi:hypothetical protein
MERRGISVPTCSGANDGWMIRGTADQEMVIILIPGMRVVLRNSEFCKTW